jgi:diadenosine tetraphosphatase ApaH/serine/threonine PP2A family protein phosphatase
MPSVTGCILFYQIRTIDRVCEIPHEGPFCDLMWSDPEDIETWAVSPRGAGWLFGRKVTSEFNNINGERRHNVNCIMLHFAACATVVFDVCLVSLAADALLVHEAALGGSVPTA